MSQAKIKAAEAARMKIIQRMSVDPAYAIFTWFKTFDEHDSKNSVKLFPDKHYLRWTLSEWHDTDERVIYTAKSRQLMVSWLLSAYGLWTALYRPNSTVLWQSTKLEHAAPFIFEKSWQHARMAHMLHQLPPHLRCCKLSDGTFFDIEDVNAIGSNAKLVFPNGSKCEGLAQGKAQSEGKVPTLFISDEGSLQDEFAASMAAIAPSIDKEAKLLAVGTMRLPSDFGADVATSWDVDPNGEGRGLARFRTAEGAYGIRVHYSADPDKDPETPIGAAWRRGQLESGAYKGGEKGWRWQQHMEINPLSRAGTLCIPAFRDIQSRIVIPNLTYEQTWGWSFDGGLDWGVRNNTVLLIFGMRPDNRRFLLWSFSKPGGEFGGIPGVCAEFKKSPWFDRVNGAIHADPSLWNTDQNLVGGLTDKATIFMNNGVDIYPARIKGQEADEVGLDRLNHYYWKDPYSENFEPTFFICEQNLNVIKNFPNLMYQEYSEATAHEHQLKEVMKDLHVDEWDAFKYAETAAPEAPRHIPSPEPGTVGWHKMRRAQSDSAKKPGSGTLYLLPIAA